MLAIVAQGLGTLLDQVVFVGGATVSLYIDDLTALEPAPSEDIDCVIAATTPMQYAAFEKELRRRGFQDAALLGHDGAPVCRKVFREITVDVMPQDPKILGFANRWYKEGVKSPRRVAIPGHDAIVVSIFASPYFIASKLVAYRARGQRDPRLSRDLEDIISVLDGRTTIEEEILGSADEVKGYIRRELEFLLTEEEILREAIEGVLRDPHRARKTLGTIRRLASGP